MISKDKILQYIVVRAIQEDQTLCSYDDLTIDKEVTQLIDDKSAQLFDLVDEHLDARERGFIESSNEVLRKISEDETLRLLAAYHLTPSMEVNDEQ